MNEIHLHAVTNWPNKFSTQVKFVQILWYFPTDMCQMNTNHVVHHSTQVGRHNSNRNEIEAFFVVLYRLCCFCFPNQSTVANKICADFIRYDVYHYPFHHTPHTSNHFNTQLKHNCDKLRWITIEIEDENKIQNKKNLLFLTGPQFNLYNG